MCTCEAFTFSTVLSKNTMGMPLSITLLYRSTLCSLSHALIRMPSTRSCSIIRMFSLSCSGFSLEMAIITLYPCLRKMA